MSPSVVPEVSVSQVDELLAAGAALLDVREPSEWEAGHAGVAHHLPLGQLSLDDLPEGRPLLVVCRVGGRSAAAAEALVGAGVEAINVGGGMLAWQRAGLPVVTNAGEPGQII